MHLAYVEGGAVGTFGNGSGDYIKEVASSFKFRYLGLGFLWAWIYCTWFTPVLFPRSTGLTVNNDISWLVSLATVVVTLFSMSILLRDKDLSSVPGVAFIAGPTTTLGAVMMSFEPLFGIEIPAVSIIGAVITGIASGWLWMLWGEFTGKVEQELAEIFIPLCVAVPLVAVFFCTFISGAAAGLAICCLPIISGWLLNLSLNDTEIIKPVSLLPFDDRPKFLGDFVRVGLGSLSIYACLAFAWGVLEYSSVSGWGDTHLVSYSIGAAGAIVVAVISILYSSHLDLFGLYRWLIPVIFLGLVLLVIEGFWAKFFALLLITIGQFGFDIIVWIYFSRIVRKGVCSGSFAIGVNRGFIQAGVLIGSLLAMGLTPLLERGELTLPLVVLILSGVMTSIVLRVLNRRDGLERITAKEVGSMSSSDTFVIDYEVVCDRLALQYGLTLREREVLGYLARGRSLPYIREVLVLSKNTVGTHTKNLYRKLDIHSRQDLFDLIEKPENDRS